MDCKKKNRPQKSALPRLDAKTCYFSKKNRFKVHDNQLFKAKKITVHRKGTKHFRYIWIKCSASKTNLAQIRRIIKDLVKRNKFSKKEVKLQMMKQNKISNSFYNHCLKDQVYIEIAKLVPTAKKNKKKKTKKTATLQDVYNYHLKKQKKIGRAHV